MPVFSNLSADGLPYSANILEVNKPIG